MALMERRHHDPEREAKDREFAEMLKVCQGLHLFFKYYKPHSTRSVSGDGLSQDSPQRQEQEERAESRSEGEQEESGEN